MPEQKRQNFFNTFFYQFPKNIIQCFKGYNLLWQALAILITYICVSTGFDWSYYTFFRNTGVYRWLFPAAIIGGILPIITPLIIYALGKISSNARTMWLAGAIGQAGIIAWLISSFAKAITGRLQPPRVLAASTANISDVFRFGFWRGGIFWGWPSSHTTVAFAMSTTLLILFPKNKLIRWLAPLYALYIGIGVSVSIHWFSEFIAGAIIGIVIGAVVGKSFKTIILKQSMPARTK